MDDLSGIALMALLFAVVPVLRGLVAPVSRAILFRRWPEEVVRDGQSGN
ncbi:hypothetical protein [Citreimonas salinaria]|uniref:Uncharacterized protein n=1 Tax=Citreimonas salinaria TaxID=321339 RepID=A0A1H3KBK6_9RHOB|nr:hypothetical protein [Citreimonas salinaria]SDY48978.1 hypothetical protein SAMN05444340_10917 [Citreimonas salinaria]